MPPQFYQGRRRGDLGLPGRMPNIDEMLGAAGPQLQSQPTGTPPSPMGAQGLPVEGDVRSMAHEQYRDAILRRLGGGGDASQMSESPALTASPVGAPPQGVDTLQSLLRTRPTRRVLRGAQGGSGGNLPQ